MIAIDIIIALLFIFAAWKGYSKGIIMQLISFAALIIGILAAYFFWNELYQILQRWMEAINPYILKAISVVAIVLVVTLLILLLGKMLSKIIRISLFGVIDHLLGMLCGMAQVALLISFLIFALLYINPDMEFLQDSQLSKSFLLPYIKPMAPYIIHHFL